MHVYIANFGRGNWAWRECLARKTLMVMDDVRVHPFWMRGDREGYIAEAQKVLRQAGGERVIKPVASRWFNLNNVLMNTVDDLWIHREKDVLWWTESLDAPPESSIIDDPNPRAAPTQIYVYHKACGGWSDRDKSGRPLRWNALHAKAREFLFTEGTFQQLSEDNVIYAKALIAGEPLSGWHDRPEWRSRVDRSKEFPVSYADARKKTVIRMAATAFGTAAQSGDVSTVTKKDKDCRFATPLELEMYIDELIDRQGGCAP